MFAQSTKIKGGKMVLLVLLFAMIIYMFMLTVSLPRLQNDMDGLAVFDMRPMGYSFEEAREIVSTISEEGTDYYKSVQLPIDFIYPVLLALFGMLALGYFSNRVYVPRISYILPLFVVMADYIENIYIYTMLSGNLTESMVNVSSFFTVLKSLSTTVLLTELSLLAVMVLRKFIKSRNVNAGSV